MPDDARPVDLCYHVEVSPGQMCFHLDQLMWTRLALELACRRVVELEHQLQTQTPRTLSPGSEMIPE